MKKILMMMIVITLLLSTFVANVQATGDDEWQNLFIDVNSDDWFYDYVEYAVTTGLFVGISDEEFAPNTAMTRAMFVTILWRFANEPTTDTSNEFYDVDDDLWYTDAVDWAAANSIIFGTSVNVFSPYEELSRQQMAGILYRYLQFSDKIPPDLVITSKDFSDWDNFSPSAVIPVNMLTSQDILRGRVNGTFGPRDPVTRAEAATAFNRVQRYVTEYVTDIMNGSVARN